MCNGRQRAKMRLDSPVLMSSDEWTFRPVKRPMYLFGRKLFHVAAPLWVCETHFSRLSDDAEAVPKPLGDHPHAEGAVIRSQPLRADLPTLQRVGDLYRWAPKHFDRQLVRTVGGFAEYLAKFSGKTRNGLSRKVKKYIESAGPDPLKVYRTPDELGVFLAAAATLAEKSYQARVFGNQLPNTPEFVAHARQLAAEGRTLGVILEHQGRPACFWWFTLDHGVLLSEFTGFDSELRALSPGTVLLYLLLPQLFANLAIEVLDFGEGDNDYKRLFATESRRCAEVFWLRLRPSTVAMVGVETALVRLRQALQPLEAELERRGWRAKLKRLVRGQI